MKEINILSSFAPYWLESSLIFTFLLWFINLFNFMDGIDGISGTQCSIMGIGSMVSCFILNEDSSLILFIAGFLTGGSLAFLCWNWHPAKVFLGDVGSIPIGLISAVLLILLYKNNMWFCALILCNYYLIDSSFTLFKRLLKKQKPWEAHKEHFYQIAIQNGKTHSKVCKAIGFHGVLMILFSLIASYFNSHSIIGICLILSILSSILLIFYFLDKKDNRKPVND
jgi:UDP-N-acetylmuramyl pentapeptide phosphotransferase/UDP-N-acetylglucosamine-1-phosphate transferase